MSKLLSELAHDHWQGALPQPTMLAWQARIQPPALTIFLQTQNAREAFAPVLKLVRRLERGVADVIIKHGGTLHMTLTGFDVQPCAAAKWR